MKSEIQAFLAHTKQQMLEREMHDVYVTDHKHIAKKFSTLSAEEDMEYYNYVRSLEGYNQAPAQSTRVSQFNSGRFEKGTMKQRIFEPLAGAQKLANGTLFYEVSEKELSAELNEDKMRAAFDRMKAGEALEAGDEGEIRIAMYDALEEAGYDLEEWDKVLAREMNTFKEGEKYDYSVDMRRTFDQGLATPTAAKIFAKIPDHVFWDIKTPRAKPDEHHINPYNPARKYPFQSFFDMRRHEDWIQSREDQRNLNTNISQHTRI